MAVDSRLKGFWLGGWDRRFGAWVEGLGLRFGVQDLGRFLLSEYDLARGIRGDLTFSELPAIKIISHGVWKGRGLRFSVQSSHICSISFTYGSVTII